jgi:CRP-like cAMP-binding protein
VLKEGHVQLYVSLPNEGEITLSMVEAASIFGEIAVAGQGSGKVRAKCNHGYRKVSRRFRGGDLPSVLTAKSNRGYSTARGGTRP